ncbi:MAG: VWA domain-containing protein [Elusimicrobia bacterium]|nr:VWA domain-containing protein [Elusimicrobiota bacterium]
MTGLFQQTAYLYWILFAAAGIVALGIWSEKRRRRLLEAFASPETLKRLYSEEEASARRLKYWLEAAALCLVLAALAGPQWGVELVETRNPGSQAVIAVDTSLSMAAEDIKPNRMDKAKSALSHLIDGLKGARVGIAAFEAEAQIQCPLTTDLDAAKSFLKRVKIGMIPQAGTSLGRGILLAAAMLSRYPGQKSVILLSDGENLEGSPKDAALQAAQAGVRIYLIGTGTPEGEPIPIRDESGRLLGYKKDPRGQTVLSKLNEAGMMEVAAASGGAYYRATQSENEVGEILKQIESSDKSSAGSGVTTRLRNRYRLPLLAAVLLLLVELIIVKLKPAALKRISARPLALTALLVFCGCSPSSDVKLWKGNKAYDQGRYEDAFEQYARALKKGSKDPKPLFNAGDALFKMGDYDRAEESFKKLADPKKSPKKTAAASYYNLGNSLFKKSQIPEAAEAFRRCLVLDPSDEDCRHNLALALQRPPQRKDPKQEQQNKGGGQDQKQPPPKQKSSSQQKQQEQKGGMSKDDAQRILQAVQERERQAKPPQPQQKGKPSYEKPGEDW